MSSLPSTSLLRLGLVVAGALLSYAFVACATGDANEPPATGDGAVVHDSGSGDAGKDTKDSGDAGPVCADASPSNTCTTPIDVGSIAPGKSVQV